MSQGTTKGVPILVSGTLTGAADTNVPSSTSVKTYIDTADTLKAPLASPTFTGTVTAPTLTLSNSLNTAKWTDIASDATTDLGGANGNYGDVTGTTTITAFGTVQAGTRRTVTFTGILTLTHNATSLILLNAANIVTAAKDVAEFVSLGSGNWKCTFYSRAGAHHGNVTVTSGVAFTTPANTDINTVWRIWMLGAGGGGGGINTSNQCASAGGGGGGVYITKTGLAGGTTYTCAIGTAGTGGTAAPTNGTAGTDTTLLIGATTYTASGGGLGIGAASSNGGAGGTGTNGDLNITGGNGGDSPGASAASSDSQGGFPPFGWGIGGACVRTEKPGTAGTGYGSGGAGGKGLAEVGGDGKGGLIFAEWSNY